MQYRVHLYTPPSNPDGRPYWAVAIEHYDLVEVGGYDEAVEMATNLAAADAILSFDDVEVVVDATDHCAARRILFRGSDLSGASSKGRDGAA